MSGIHQTDEHQQPHPARGKLAVNGSGKRLESNAHSSPDETPDAPALLDTDVKERWHIRSPADLAKRCGELDTGQHLVERLIPDRSLVICLGDSGIGKSPLAYQLAVCVASGRCFLGLKVRRYRVIYLDFEDGLQQVHELVARLARHLGLNAPPENLLLWNFNDRPAKWKDSSDFFDFISAVDPGLVIIDPLTALEPEAENKNSEATAFYQQLRRAIRHTGCSILGLHHRKKQAPLRGSEQPTTLSGSNFRRWFEQARGAGVLLNGADVRLGVEGRLVRSHTEQAKAFHGRESSPAEPLEQGLVLRGYARGRGEIPAIHLRRILDPTDGLPLGYEKLSGALLLGNQSQQHAYERLPQQFSFKQAKQTYDKQDQATSKFLEKCITSGILRKVAQGVYMKIAGEVE